MGSQPRDINESFPVTLNHITTEKVKMDLRTKETIDRKLSEARQKRNEAKEKERQAENKKDAARAKQREEELYNKKAEEATKQLDKLKQERERCLDRIRDYYRHIDGCSQEMSKSM